MCFQTPQKVISRVASPSLYLEEISGGPLHDKRKKSEKKLHHRMMHALQCINDTARSYVNCIRMKPEYLKQTKVTFTEAKITELVIIKNIKREV